MKRNIVFNEHRTAIAISDHLRKSIELVCEDSMIGEEVFAFDTSLHIAYAYKIVRNGFTMVESEVPIMQFRNFKTIGNCSEIYKEIIQSINR